MATERSKSILKMCGVNVDVINSTKKKASEDVLCDNSLYGGIDDIIIMEINYTDCFTTIDSSILYYPDIPSTSQTIILLPEPETTESEDPNSAMSMDVVGKEGLKKPRKNNIKKIRKQNKSKGQSHTAYNNSKVIVPGKGVQPVACQSMKCLNKCCNSFSEDDRQKLFDQFWGLNETEKRCFLISAIKENEVKRRYLKTSGKRKQRFSSFIYSLPKDNQ